MGLTSAHPYSEAHEKKTILSKCNAGSCKYMCMNFLLLEEKMGINALEGFDCPSPFIWSTHRVSYSKFSEVFEEWEDGLYHSNIPVFNISNVSERTVMHKPWPPDALYDTS
jgi:hypothetical protein